MLKVESDGPVLRLTLARPEVRNAFNDELIALLTEAFTLMAQGSRAVVLQGEGKVFSAGGDLEWMRRAANYTEDQNFEDALSLARLFESIARCPAVVIARVHGAAFGGGAGLVASSDIAICEPATKFAFSEVKLGLLPGTISTYVIPKIGAGHARALFATGETFDSERALRMGLVHEVVASDELDAAVDRKIDAVLSAGPLATSLAKRLVLESPVPIEDSARRLARARASDEGREGVAAFLEKRPANFVVERNPGEAKP